MTNTTTEREPLDLEHVASTITRLPFDDLAGFIRRHADLARTTTAATARLCDVSRETVYRWRQSGVPVFAADRVAVLVLGVPPAAIWGEMWWRTVDPMHGLSESLRVKAKLERSMRNIAVIRQAIDAQRDGAPWPQLRVIEGARRPVEQRARRIDSDAM